MGLGEENNLSQNQNGNSYNQQVTSDSFLEQIADGSSIQPTLENGGDADSIAWWSNFKTKLQNRFNLEMTPLNASRISYYKVDENSNTLIRTLASGSEIHEYNDDNADTHLKNMPEPTGKSQIDELKKALEEGRLFFFELDKYAGDKAHRITLKGNDLVIQDFYKKDDANKDVINKTITSPVDKPAEPAGVGFFTKVLAFFGNSKARDKVNEYNDNYRQYQADLATWNNDYKDCKTREERVQLKNAALLHQCGMKNEIEKVCSVHRAILDGKSIEGLLDETVVENTKDVPQSNINIKSNEQPIIHEVNVNIESKKKVSLEKELSGFKPNKEVQDKQKDVNVKSLEKELSGFKPNKTVQDKQKDNKSNIPQANNEHPDMDDITSDEFGMGSLSN